MSALENRYDFVLFFDVENGNPNGDPDAGNLPRIDPETGLGLVTDVCLKRKVRNYIDLVGQGEPALGIYVRENSILNDQHRKAYVAIRGEGNIKPGKLNPQTDEEAHQLKKFMCEHFYDVRTFGAVMSTGVNCGQVRGPIQMTFAQSIDPISPAEVSITRMAATTEKEKQQRTEGENQGDERKDNRTMGRKHIVPYGLYRANGFINAPLANQTGFDAKDLELFWTAMEQMFEHDRSAARGLMSTRKLIIFKHSNRLGDAPAHALFDRITVSNAPDANTPPRHFKDYTVSINREGLPSGVEIIERI
ncbi:type I-C CRISPR-associated protein Cas7/Csd2 [Woodsholea maritima]|uniref:type I-C CRISPR-associated protein Cas7/Csd2 n=1 Tax=Woodsholea maritima TaxID=240237 RepID=UPI00037215AC|nr:type I-C CRISPR-associated protein Cas7/Csd2 [Woodsholea maritima]